ncbi:MAG: chloride channel protein [Nitrososphaeria archaeon]
MKSSTQSALTFLEKWTLLGIVIGAVAGLSSVVLYFLIRAIEYFLLVRAAGIYVPIPPGEGGTLGCPPGARFSPLLPAIAGIGGLLSALIIRFSPEASGNGTDRAIESYHFRNGTFSRWSWAAKMLSSAVTIGSGGSAGREGPEAFISAGISSGIFSLLRLSPEDRRLAVAVAMGAGIGTIFKAPIAGAILSAELLYRRDFEYEAIFPSLIASSVGFLIFGAFVGYGPIFGLYQYSFFLSSVWLFLLLGVLTGAMAYLYVRSLRFFEGLFLRISAPRELRALVGGVLVGALGLLFPEVLSVGYGWMGYAIQGRLFCLRSPLPLYLFLVLLPFLKILATSLTLGSGASGGEFAPGIFIGGATGLMLYSLLQLAGIRAPYFPLIVVGMASLFGAAANAPLSVMIMAIEMTGSVELFPPAMIASSISYIIASGVTPYPAQVPTRKDSPVHSGEYSALLLSRIRVEEARLMNFFIRAEEDARSAERRIRESGLLSLPVVDEQGNFLGTVSLLDLAGHSGRAGEMVVKGVPYVRPDSTLLEAWEIMSRTRSNYVPVVKRGKLIGILTMDGLVEVYKGFLRI